MKILRNLLLGAAAAAALAGSTITAAEARWRSYGPYEGTPVYSYYPYGGGYARPSGGYYGYYGSAYGRICEPERDGHISRYTCEYRY